MLIETPLGGKVQCEVFANIYAGMVELADTSDLSSDEMISCGFKSHYQHHVWLFITISSFSLLGWQPGIDRQNVGMAE